MARQPHEIQPFEPFASGRQQKTKPSQIVTDDRRSWFKTVPGLVFSNEILIPGSGTTPLVQALREAIHLRLPRPEPVTLSFHPWWTNDTSRFRLQPHLFAEVEPDTVAANQAVWARIYVEWGTGQSRAWTYLDAGPGSLQLPSVSDVRVSGWSYVTPYILSVNAQIGYASADLSATWSFHKFDTIAGVHTKNLPNFARELTAYAGWPNSAYVLNDLGDVAIADNSNTDIGSWDIRPPLAPNPAQTPYPCVKVPITAGARIIKLRNINTAGVMKITAVVTVKL